MPQTALITGASGGIGLELAKIFASEKNDLVLVARSEDKLNKLADELKLQYKINIHVLPKDLTDINAAKEVAYYCDQHAIQVDYLINNAGFGDYGLFTGSDWNKQLHMINLNITTLAYFTRLWLPAMVKRGSGKIMNIASTASFLPGPLMSVYYASKAFVLHFSEAIANEVEKTGVTITAFCPGATATGFQRTAGLEESKMVKGKKMSSAEKCALSGYHAMMLGKAVAIHGFMNTLMITSVRFCTRAFIRKIVRNIQDKRS